MSQATLTTAALLPPSLPLLAAGKCRDLYSLDADTLLMVATDRISSFDVPLSNGIPGKGRLLTLLTAHWIRLINEHLPSIKTHFISLDLPSAIPASSRTVLQERTMVVRKCKILPIEAIVRKYLYGSAWLEYQKHGTVHGIPLPPGLRESEALPGGPLFTPSTKAPPGEHDENISPEKVKELIGEHYAERVESLAVSIFRLAARYAEERGIIIADTKFEFGIDETGEVVLCDEVLTPDSSRFWSRGKYEVGKAQESFDKQPLRNWLVEKGLKGKEGVEMPEDVVLATAERYREAYEQLTGDPLNTDK